MSKPTIFRGKGLAAAALALPLALLLGACAGGSSDPAASGDATAEPVRIGVVGAGEPYWETYTEAAAAETTAAAKIIIDTDTDQILGAHLLGPGYSELINTFGIAIKLGLTTRQLKSTTATYPSLGSDLGSLL